VSRLREVGIEFLDSAPLQWEFEAAVAAPRAAVFAAVAERADWPWFPGLTGERYEGQQPYGVGTRRHIRMAGVAYHETIVAWSAPSRWAFRVDECSVPMARALVEEWSFRESGAGTTVRWCFAIDPSPAFGAMKALAPTVMRALFVRAMRNLERVLREE
jgi:hypothetical protein